LFIAPEFIRGEQDIHPQKNPSRQGRLKNVWFK
jgi:hypothetical protein